MSRQDITDIGSFWGVLPVEPQDSFAQENKRPKGGRLVRALVAFAWMITALVALVATQILGGIVVLWAVSWLPLLG